MASGDYCGIGGPLNVLQASAAVKSALPQLSRPEQLVVLGVSDLETSFGNWGSDPTRGAGSNNMGAVTDPNYHQGDPASLTQFLHTDTRPNPTGVDEAHPDGQIHYTTAFRKYATPEAGFTDVAVNTVMKPNVKAAVATGNLWLVSAAMYQNHYYTGVHATAKANIDAHAKRLIGCVADIVASTGETNPFLPVQETPELKAGLPLSFGSQPSRQSGASFTSPPTLRFGSLGVGVQAWQRILKTKVDGDFGPSTRRLTREWQSAHGLTDDGVVGPETWRVALV